MVGKGHLWSGSVSLITCSSVEIFLVHPHVDNFVNMIRLNELLQSSIVSNFVNIYDKIMMHFNDVNVMNLLFIGICVCCYYLGLLLPDIDSKDSTISKILHFHIPINHRGFMHTIYWVVLYFVLGILITPIFLFLGQGYLIHLFFDSMSTAGICWLYPFSKHRVYYGTVMTRRHHLILYNSDGGEVLVNVFVTIIAIIIMAFIILSKGGLF